jgi:hypothetical protein
MFSFATGATIYDFKYIGKTSKQALCINILFNGFPRISCSEVGNNSTYFDCLCFSKFLVTSLYFMVLIDWNVMSNFRYE